MLLAPDATAFLERAIANLLEASSHAEATGQ
jgi:hypothetical protein